MYSKPNFIVLTENEECSPGCFISWIGDGDCDLECNVPKCDNDDYDCSYEGDSNKFLTHPSTWSKSDKFQKPKDSSS